MSQAHDLMMKHSLVDIPEDVLAVIMRYLHVSDLAALACTNSILHQIVRRSDQISTLNI
jgi:hypothetical protein